LGGSFLTKVTDLVVKAIEPLITANHDDLVDIEYVKEKSQYYLRIYVDREGVIDINEIARLSDLVSEKLDSLDPDPLPNPYILELSSPGLERPIKTERDWEQAKGQYIHVTLYQKIDQAKIYEGKLLAYDQDKLQLEIKIKTRTKKITIPRKVIAKSRFAIEF
jgi:ribosome maturation factor RimP